MCSFPCPANSECQPKAEHAAAFILNREHIRKRKHFTYQGISKDPGGIAINAWPFSQITLCSGYSGREP